MSTTTYEAFEDDFVLDPPKSKRARKVSYVLLALLLAAGTFWGGAEAQARWGTSSQGGFGGGQMGQMPTGGDSAPTGMGGFGGAATAAASEDTTGTIASIDGNTINVTTDDGSTVAVTLNGSSTVQTATSAKLQDLTAGQAITVSGKSSDDGSSVTANTVTATATP